VVYEAGSTTDSMDQSPFNVNTKNTVDDNKQELHYKNLYIPIDRIDLGFGAFKPLDVVDR